MKGLIQEISARSPLAPALANADSTTRLPTSVPGVEAISRTATTPTDRHLWIMAASAAPGTHKVTIRGFPKSERWADVYTEHRAVPVVKGRLTDRFSQWQVHVYELSVPTGKAV